MDLGLRLILHALWHALTQLLEVMLLQAIGLCIFSLIALELYMGKLRQVCVLIKGGEVSNKLKQGYSAPIKADDPNKDTAYNMYVFQV